MAKYISATEKAGKGPARHLPRTIGTALAQNEWRGVLCYCNSPLMNTVEAHIHFKPRLIKEDGQVTEARTADFLRNYNSELRAFIVQVLTVLPRPLDVSALAAVILARRTVKKPISHNLVLARILAGIGQAPSSPHFTRLRLQRHNLGVYSSPFCSFQCIFLI